MTGGALSAHVVVHRRAGFTIDVQTDAAPGEVVAIMGPSGAGKSTLLTAIAGLQRLDAGRVAINGRDVANPTTRVDVRPALRGVVLLGQEPRLFPHLTACENVAFGPRARGVARRDARARADEWLERVGLPGAGGVRPAELSGGQQQRVAIARALATAPHLLLLDEPLTSLDPETAAEVRTVLAEQLAATDTTTLIVTHDVVDAASLASTLVVIEGGRVTQSGPVRDVLAAPATGFGATIAGVNRVEGVVMGGTWHAGESGRSDAGMALPSRFADGPVVALVRPLDVWIDTAGDGADGSDAAGRAAWEAAVARIEQTPAGVRVHTTAPRVAADVTIDRFASLGLALGDVVRLSVDPADVRFVR